MEEAMKRLMIASALVMVLAPAAVAQTADKSGVDPAVATKRLDTAVPPMKMDSTGKSDLGVDISNAGKDPAAQQKFVEALPSDQQANVKKVCVVAVTEPAEHAAEVIHFCKNVTQ
jgi:hypothetical protein